MFKNPKPKVFIVEDHEMLRDALCDAVLKFTFCDLDGKAGDGSDLIRHLKMHGKTDIVLLDIEMPGMDGLETATWLYENKPEIKILIYTLYENPALLLQLLKFNVCGFVPKNVSRGEFKEALFQTVQSGCYFTSEKANQIATVLLNNKGERRSQMDKTLTAKELDFLRIFCRDVTYKEIAAEQNISVRTIENYKEALCEKLGVKNRIGLAVYAIQNKLVTP